MKIHKTIIIGGGISGLACAKTLTDNSDDDFLLITKDLGGRMLTSKSLTVDYGASYVTTEYKNVLNFVDKGDPLRQRDIYYIQKETISNLFSLRNLLFLPKILKLVYVVNDYLRRMAKFRERSLTKCQKEALKEDAVLEMYSKMPAKEFIKKHKLEYLHETFIHPVLQSTIFTKADKSNVLYYLGVLAPLVRKTYAADFRHVIPRITKDFKNNIILDELISLEKNKKGQYLVKTKKNRYLAKNVVVAAPYTSARKFYPVHKTGPVISVYVIHIVGKREEVYQKKKVVFFKPKHHDITILWRQHTGSDIVFTKNPNPNLDKYYEHHHIVRKVYWKHSLILSGDVDNWADQELGKNLYLASDYNLCGLEDAFITGVYAANQIAKSK